MNDSNSNVLVYLEDRIIKLQTQINDLQQLINHYRIVAADYKKNMKVDMHENMRTNEFQPEETVTL